MQKVEARRFQAVIADDHQMVRAGLKSVISAPGVIEETGIEVIGEASNGLETIEVVKRLRPDLLLLDVQMPLASGSEILTDLKRWSPDTKIVVLTAVTSVGLLSGLVDGGVEGLFSKGADNAEFVAKLPLILRGGKHVEEALAALIRDNAGDVHLTQRERQTLNMVISGKTNNEIAELMGVSPKTAEKHRGSLMGKMGVKSAVELMSKALREGLIETAMEHGST